MKTVEVGGYTPLMRAGIHTGRPQRIGSDWLGVDVNVAARVMDRATRGGLVVSNVTLAGISDEDFESLGITVETRTQATVLGEGRPVCPTIS